MNDVATRVERTGFYAGQSRWVAIAVKVIVVALVLWASLAADAGRFLMEFQSATIGYFGGWFFERCSAARLRSACSCDSASAADSSGFVHESCAEHVFLVARIAHWRCDRAITAEATAYTK